MTEHNDLNRHEAVRDSSPPRITITPPTESAAIAMPSTDELHAWSKQVADAFKETFLEEIFKNFGLLNKTALVYVSPPCNPLISAPEIFGLPRDPPAAVTTRAQIPVGADEKHGRLFLNAEGYQIFNPPPALPGAHQMLLVLICCAVPTESFQFLIQYTPPPAALSPLGRACSQCFAHAHLRCSGCKQVFYCTKGCQKTHWRTHKAACLQAQQQSVPPLPQTFYSPS